MAEKTSKKVLIIGGHGRVALIATPKLIAAGHDVTSVIRNPNHVSDIEAIGATPLVRDIIGLDVATWEKRLQEFDVVVWAAGHGDSGSVEGTYAVDRDAALTSVEAVRNLLARGERAPRYIMVSFLGSLNLQVDPEDDFYAYAESKKKVDRELLATEGLDSLILAPGVLSMDPSHGGTKLHDENEEVWERRTSRYLVADLITEMVGRERLPEQKVLAFTDGSTPADQF